MLRSNSKGRDGKGKKGKGKKKEDEERRKEEEERMLRGEEARDRERNLAATQATKAAPHSEVEGSEGDEVGSDAGSTVHISTGKRRDLGPGPGLLQLLCQG